MYYCLKCKQEWDRDDLIFITTDTTDRKENVPACPLCKIPCLNLDKEEAQKGIEIIETLTRLVNSLSLSGDLHKLMAIKLALTHRTLQQSTMRLLYGIIVEYSKSLEKMGTDLRNEDAKAFADRVAQMEDVYFSLI